MKKTDRVMTVESGRHRAYRIYITDGISPAITTPSGGGLIPKIIEYEERRITSVQKDNLLVEPVRIKANTQKGFEEVGEYGAVNISRPESTTRRGRVQGDKGDIVGTLTTGEENAVVESLASIQRCRIRRLTPRECFRLQDVSEEDIDKIQNYEYPYGKSGKMKHISESQQYKLAGNSIPVACMFYIFKNLFSSPVEKAADAAPVQLDIFDITD